MKKLLVLFFTLGLSTSAMGNVTWPSANYQIGNCLTPLNTAWSWYGKTAIIQDIVFSKYLNGFAYKVYIFNLVRPQSLGYFSLNAIDNNTAEVTSCPQ